jgi:hypothetical protein
MPTKTESGDPQQRDLLVPGGGWQLAFWEIADALNALSNGEPELRWQNHLNFMADQFRNQSQN